MPAWYLYYRILHALHHPAWHMRLKLQDILCSLRNEAVQEFPNATDQDVQDWFEHLADNPTAFTKKEAAHLTKMEPWAS